MKNLGISEQLMYSTVRIECVLNGGSRSTGTGYFFKFLEGENGRHVPCIVTNKHVVDGAINGKILFTTSDSNGDPVNTDHFIIEYNNFQQHFIYHPDPNVDLCIIPIAEAVQTASQKGKNLFYIALDKNLIPTVEQMEQLGAIEEVNMIGYPNGLWDQVNNLPIIRKGITATHPKFNYNGKEEVVIDAACFPGSSGSPVIILNEGTYRQGSTVHVGSRVLLLGTLYAGPQFTAKGEIVQMNIPSEGVFAVRQMMNLGYVIKAKKLLDFEIILNKLIKQ
ncbi:S1 family peptidase [Sutcliffiella horikoshii]|uniref:S1 family peptidase n=1 Tax=Sutcliffiella horikoshii TaxID=79883 RepID=UPI003CF9BB64